MPPQRHSVNRNLSSVSGHFGTRLGPLVQNGADRMQESLAFKNLYEGIAGSVRLQHRRECSSVAQRVHRISIAQRVQQSYEEGAA
jgi:hypothetical protein